MARKWLDLMVCAGTGCIASGCLKVKDALIEELEKHNLMDEVNIELTGCNGFCAAGPIITVYPDQIFYQRLKPEDMPYFVEEHIIKGRIAEKLLYRDPVAKAKIPKMKDIGFFANQQQIALRNRGIIDAEDIDEYIGRDGYFALAKALSSMTQEQIIEEVKKSGLRGRGGAGFPTGLKWEFTRKAKGNVKYIVCNADEGDPGAFMDRSIMEGDPHSVIEGMIIAGYAIGSNQGYVYIRAEYPLAVKRLTIAINQAREYGLLGKDILGSGFDFDIEIYPGAGAFVCGEETALLCSIEGKRGMPRPRPPYPAISGLWRKPTNINNVETYANINPIILYGGDWFASIGTEKSKGTKVFALTGAINNIGLVEVPMGTTLRQLVFDVGGGIQKKRQFKAAQLGGPSGGCLPADLLDTPIDFDSLTEAGAMMGSGGVVVMDNTTCMVDTARFFLEFTVDESCGKCVPCRVGLKVMFDKLTDIVSGRGKEGDIEFLQDLAMHVKTTSHCGLGQTAPNPILSTIRYFRSEYEAHIKEKFCPTHVCVELIRFEVDEEKCKCCGACFKVCPSEAIVWEKKQPAKIIKERCIKCKSCIAACNFDSIY